MLYKRNYRWFTTSLPDQSMLDREVEVLAHLRQIYGV